MSVRMKFENTIEINAPIQNVFDYISDVANDTSWRSEVDRMDVQGEIKVGTLAIEYSTLFGPFVKTVTPTRIVILESPHKVVYETEASVEPWLTSRRYLKEINPNCTLMTYQLESDLPASGVIGKLYNVLMKKLYGPRLPKYLNELKRILEAA